MIFVLGMWIYLLAMIFDSEDEDIQYTINLVGMVGVLIMGISVSMSLWEKMP